MRSVMVRATRSSTREKAVFVFCGESMEKKSERLLPKSGKFDVTGGALDRGSADAEPREAEFGSSEVADRVDHLLADRFVADDATAADLVTAGLELRFDQSNHETAG